MVAQWTLWFLIFRCCICDLILPRCSFMAKFFVQHQKKIFFLYFRVRKNIFNIAQDSQKHNDVGKIQGKHEIRRFFMLNSIYFHSLKKCNLSNCVCTFLHRLLAFLCKFFIFFFGVKLSKLQTNETLGDRLTQFT